jgi:fatty acid desaturase
MTASLAESWRAKLEPKRAAELQELYELRRVWNFIVFFYFGLWAAGAILVLHSSAWQLKIIGYVSIGLGIHAAFTLMHEGSHGNLFRNRVLDRWMGFVCSAPAFLAPTAYKVIHLEHHRWLRTERDPEELTNVSDRAWVQSLAFWCWALIGGATFPFVVPFVGFARGSRRERRAMAVEYALILTISLGAFALAVHYDATAALVECWILPLIVTVLVTNVRGWAEHSMTIKGSPWTESRTVTSNRLVSLLMGGTNYHLEHHLCAGVPWYNLHRLHELLPEERRAAGSPVYASYLEFIRDAVRTGVHGVAMGRVGSQDPQSGARC